MSVTSMIVIAILLIILLILFALWMYYKHQAFECNSYPAIRCCGDWQCYDSNAKLPFLVDRLEELQNKLGDTGTCSYGNPAYWEGGIPLSGTFKQNLYNTNCPCDLSDAVKNATSKSNPGTSIPTNPQCTGHTNIPGFCYCGNFGATPS